MAMKITLTLLIAASFAVQFSKQDSCHLRELDLCVATTIVSLRDSPVPQNEEQIEQQCKVGQETIDCIRNYTNKCATKLQRELIGFVTQGGQDSFKQYCTPGSELRKSILEHSECLSQAWEEQKSCVSDAQAGLESISDAPAEKRIDTLCCTYRRYRKCGLDVARKNCGDDIEEFINHIMSLVAGNLPNLVCNYCGDFESKCKGLLPAPGTQPKGSNSDSPIAQLLGAYLNN